MPLSLQPKRFGAGNMCQAQAVGNCGSTCPNFKCSAAATRQCFGQPVTLFAQSANLPSLPADPAHTFVRVLRRHDCTFLPAPSMTAVDAAPATVPVRTATYFTSGF